MQLNYDEETLNSSVTYGTTPDGTSEPTVDPRLLNVLITNTGEE